MFDVLWILLSYLKISFLEFPSRGEEGGMLTGKKNKIQQPQ